MIVYEEEYIFKVIFRAECKVGLRALLFTVPSASLAVLLSVGLVHIEDILEGAGLHTITDDVLVKRPSTWLALALICILLLEFRTQQALSRFWEGTSLLHRMRGEWFDSVSCLVTFAMLEADSQPKEVKVFQHTLIRLMSLCHGSALEEIADSDFVISRLDYEGIDEVTRSNLQYCKEKYGFNRVEMVLKTIYTLMTKALDDGVVRIDPPILTRVYQTFSRGYVSLLDAKKITDTRFPFPYAQLIAALLLIMSVGIPCMMAMLIRHAVWAGVFSFVPVFGMFSLNFIASELENPFGHDENDLPLSKFQEEMNSSLLMLLHDRVDHVAQLSESAELDFEVLARRIGLPAPAPAVITHHASSRLSQFESMEFPEEDNGPQILSPEPTLDRSQTAQEVFVERADPTKAEGEKAVRRLAKSMMEFNRTMNKWTRTVECQVGELRRSYDAIKKVVGDQSSAG